MTVKQPWFVTERAEALAVVYLTRRDDLEVIPTPRQCYDFLIRIKSDSHTTEPPRFAVVTRGLERSVRSTTPAGKLAFTVDYAPEQLRGDGLPICTFVFTVDDERGYFRWLLEPVIGHNGLAELRLDREIRRPDSSLDLLKQVLDTQVQLAFTPLNEASLAEIVAKTTNWYEIKRTRKIA